MAGAAFAAWSVSYRLPATAALLAAAAGASSATAYALRNAMILACTDLAHRIINAHPAAASAADLLRAAVTPVA